MDEVVELGMITRLDLPAERILGRALEADLDAVVVMGYTKDGEEYFTSSAADGGDILWLLERLKMQLLSVEV